MANLISQPTLSRIFLWIEFKFIGQDPEAGNKQENRENRQKMLIEIPGHLPTLKIQKILI